MTTVVFDLGGVVLIWDPVPAVAAVVGQERAERFVHGTDFDFAGWNHDLDAGVPWAQAEAAATARHPDLAEEIAAYRPHFPLSLRGEVPGTTTILRELRAHGVRLVALTNWSAETFHHAHESFPEVLGLFADVVVSGAEGVAKPDPRIFDRLRGRLDQPIDGMLFVDDAPRNVTAARDAGMDAVQFTDAAALRDQLRSRGLLD